jgi:hypothetical protein
MQVEETSTRADAIRSTTNMALIEYYRQCNFSILNYIYSPMEVWLRLDIDKNFSPLKMKDSPDRIRILIRNGAFQK